VSTDDAIERFLSSTALSDATRRAYRSDLRTFGGWLELPALTDAGRWRGEPARSEPAG